LNSRQICDLIPHADDMCLLDTIVSWDKSQLVAETLSHTKTNNPLRCGDSLNSIHGIEYAAQAMAVHSALLKIEKNSQDKTKKGGYIATVRNVQIQSEYLYSPSSGLLPLIISVQVLIQDKQGYTYQFSVTQNNQHLLSGKITIFLT